MVYDHHSPERLRRNQEYAINIRQLSQFVMCNAAFLPEVKMVSDGYMGFYWEFEIQDFAGFIRETIGVMLHGVTQYEELSVSARMAPRTVMVRRFFGDIPFTLTYIWRHDITDDQKDNAIETVEAALMGAWQDRNI